jgi:hypothetical protein
VALSFLSPWLWAGAAAVALPLWLHLRAKSGPVFPFPTLRFLEDQPRPRARGFRLRDVLLFLFRAAAVLLLAAGFAWPYLDKGGRVVESRVHVLDATLSRQAGDAAGFARDRERVRRAVLEGGADAQDAVVELTSRPRVVVAFTDERVEAARRVGEMAPSFARGSYLEAVRLAQSMLSQSLGSRRRIFFYGDHQQNQWKEGESSPPFLEGVSLDLASGTEAASRPNLSVGEPGVRRFFLGEHAYVDLSVELRHDGPFQFARMRLAANGKPVLAEDLALGRETGVATLRGQWRSEPGEWLRGEIWIESASDALPADDRVYFALPPVHEGRLALLARSPYLRAALAPETMKGRWSTQALDPAGRDLATVPENELPEVLVLESDYAQSQQVRELLLRCLNNGRGVLLFVRRLTPLVKGFLAELGLEATERRRGEEDTFRLVAGDHPVFRPFLSGELGDITAPRILQHVGLTSASAVPLLYGRTGDPLLLEGTGTKGRLLVFAFGLERDQTDWPLQPSFIPFLDILLQHARQGTPLQTSAAPGELVTHEVPKGRPLPREVVLRDADRPVLQAVVDANRGVRFEAPPKPGIYALTYDADPAVQALVAVNPPAKESVLRYLEKPAAPEAWVVRTTAPIAESPVLPSRLHARDQKWWWWCLAAAAAALAIESGMLLSRRRSPHEPS